MPYHTIEHDLEGSTEVWRYMSVEKFVDLMSRKELWFARADRLSDKHEGSLPDSVINEREQRLKDHRVKEIIERGSKAGLRHAFVSCWSMETPESLSMWNIYTPPDAKGFAIKTTINRLANCFVSNSHDLFDNLGARIEKVTYIDFVSHEAKADAFDRFIHKQRAFEYEKEIRVLISYIPTIDEPPIGKGLKVDLDIIIDTIYVSQHQGDGLDLLAADLLRKAGIKKEILFPSFVRTPRY